MSNGPGPLHGIRVVEVGSFVAGPFCATQLGDLGAEVIKVESPAGGDAVRAIGPFIADESSGFMRINRNKRSLALDLKSPDGKAVFRRLVARADIVVENLRPGSMNALGLGYDALVARHPGLIYVAISGWGQDGPYADRAGLDIMAQAMSGLMSITGEDGGPPVKVGVPICDISCSLYGALAAVAALRVRDQHGFGQRIDVSLFESGVSFALWEASTYFATGEIPRRHGSAHQAIAPYQAFRSADGYFASGAANDNAWHTFVRVLHLEHLRDDPRFATPRSRHDHLAVLLPLIEAVTVTQPSALWVERLLAAGLPSAPLADYAQVFSDPHLRARGFFHDVPHETAGDVRVIGSPMRFSRTPVHIDRAGPRLGADSRAILRELGLGETEIEAAIASGVVAEPDALQPD
jgi:formyl-CoA transferase